MCCDEIIMARIVIISEIFSDGKGDFFAGKNLVMSLLQQGHQIEWLIAPFSQDPQSIAFFYSQVKTLRDSEHFTFKVLSPNHLELLIDGNSLLLAERDAVILFPNIPRNFDFSTYQKLVSEKVNLMIMYEYGIEEEWIYSSAQVNYLTEYHDLFRKLQLPILFTGITERRSPIGANISPGLGHLEQCDRSDDMLEMSPKARHDEHLWGASDGKLDSKIEYNSAGEWPCEMMQSSGDESLYELFEAEAMNVTTKAIGIFKIPAADIQALSKKTLLDVLPEDRGFIEKLLSEVPGQMASEKLDNYNQSHALFFSYSSSEYRDDGSLARFFYLCIMYTLENNPNKTTIDLIGQFHGACVDDLKKLLSEHSLHHKIKIRLFNPFPLQHETMLIFFIRAKQDGHVVLVTGDQSLGEVISLGIRFLYQVVPWKKNVADQLLKLCHTKRYFKVEALLTHDLEAVKEMCELLADPELHQQYENLHLSIPSLQESFSEVLQGLLTKHHPNAIHPLALEEIQAPESLSGTVTESSKSVAKEATIEIQPKELRKEVEAYRPFLAAQTNQDPSFFGKHKSQDILDNELAGPEKKIK